MRDDLSNALRDREKLLSGSTQEEIRSGQEATILGREIYAYETIPSTNQVALNLGEKGAPDGTLVIADFQSAGRGRYGRTWVAPAGSSLLFSLLLRPPLPPSHCFLVMMAAGLGVAEGIGRTTGLAARLKWPNDVLIAGRKVCGLLLESRILGEHLEFAVVGVGVNVNVEVGGVGGIPAEATSLQEMLGRQVARLALLRAILGSAERRYLDLQRGRSLLVEWSALLDTIGRPVRIRIGNRQEEGVAEGVTEAGALRVRRGDGRVIEVSAGEVFHLEAESA